MKFCWPRILFTAMVIALGTMSLLSACGQKGDLYLPDRGEQQDDD